MFKGNYMKSMKTKYMDAAINIVQSEPLHVWIWQWKKKAVSQEALSLWFSSLPPWLLLYESPILVAICLAKSA